MSVAMNSPRGRSVQCPRPYRRLAKDHPSRFRGLISLRSQARLVGCRATSVPDKSTVPHKLPTLALLLLLSTGMTVPVYSQSFAPQVSGIPTSAGNYLGRSNITAMASQQTSDGGYIVVAPAGKLPVGHGLQVLKLGSTGAVTWQRTLGGSANDIPYAVRETSDGGYIVVGMTTTPNDGIDGWVLKLTSTGAVTWQRSYGGPKDDVFSSIQQTSDGGYILAGRTDSFGMGKDDAWVVKLTSNGSISWQETLGGALEDVANSIEQTHPDGGYIVAGTSASFGAGGNDAWILKLTSTGAVTWQKTYGGPADDMAASVEQTTDGGYIVSGSTSSFGQGVQAWVLKLSPTGSIRWQEAFGGSSSGGANFVAQTSDGGYVVAGKINSSGTVGSDEAWVMKLSPGGEVKWQRGYESAGLDLVGSGERTNSGGYFVAAEPNFGTGSSRLWALVPPSSDRWGSVIDTNATVTTTTASARPSMAIVTVATSPGATTAITDSFQQPPKPRHSRAILRLRRILSTRPRTNALGFYTFMTLRALKGVSVSEISRETTVEHGGTRFLFARGLAYGVLCYSLYLEDFEPLTYDYMTSLSGNTFVDVGANIGGYTLRLAKRFREVIAIEPNPRAADILRKNIELNSLSNVRVLSDAISDTIGEATLSVPAGGKTTRSSIVKKYKQGSSINVHTSTLDRLLENRDRIDLIKIDVEGAELLVLKGADRTLPKTQRVVLETGPWSERQVIESLGKHGFEVSDLDRNARQGKNVLASLPDSPVREASRTPLCQGAPGLAAS